jgi:predicted DCC family thiol-disulfide oxidoreductase YuxK
VRERDRAGRVLALPNQTPGLISEHGLTRAEVDREAWTVDATGRREAGSRAVNRVLRELGGGWVFLGRVLSVPPLSWLEALGYGLVARNRSRLSRWGDRPACDEPDTPCES